MDHHFVQPAMSQKIFSMDLDVKTVSLYLLCCAVADAGAAITRTTLQEKWNGNRTTLEQELVRLEERKILCREATEVQEATVYRIVDEEKWR